MCILILYLAVHAQGLERLRSRLCRSYSGYDFNGFLAQPSPEPALGALHEKGLNGRPVDMPFTPFGEKRGGSKCAFTGNRKACNEMFRKREDMHG